MWTSRLGARTDPRRIVARTGCAGLLSVSVILTATGCTSGPVDCTPRLEDIGDPPAALTRPVEDPTSTTTGSSQPLPGRDQQASAEPTATETTASSTTTAPTPSTALSEPVSYSGNESCRKVAIIGDSQVRSGVPYLEKAFGTHYQYSIKYKNGQRMDQLFRTLEEQLETDPDIVLVEGFTNNMIQQHPGTQADFDKLLEMTSDVPCVLIMDLWRATEVTRSGTVGTQFNGRLEEAASRRSNVHWLRWDEIVSLPNGRPDPATAKYWGTYNEKWQGNVGDIIHFPPLGGFKRTELALGAAIDNQC